MYYDDNILCGYTAFDVSIYYNMYLQLDKTFYNANI